MAMCSPTKFVYDILSRAKAYAYTCVPHLVIPATRSDHHLANWQLFYLAPLALYGTNLLYVRFAKSFGLAAAFSNSVSS
jgi:hypothetical protein